VVPRVSKALRHRAKALFAAALAAADPTEGVRRALQDRPARPGPGGQVVVLAMGKAAGAMAEVALPMVPEATVVLVVTNPENARPVEGATVLAAAHPVPDAAGLAAAARVEEAATRAGAQDLVLVLVSGGASALLPAPVAGLELADKIAVNRLLLGSGLDIRQMNLVRQQLSRLKGGGLARLAAPARIRTLVLSDVIGDDLNVVASGPTLPPLGTRADARALLEKAGLWDRLPVAVRAHLSRPEAAPQAVATPDATIVGSNAISVAAMASEAGAGAKVVATDLTGDVAEACARIIAAAQANTSPTLLFGGEPTVILRGNGTGGRNQELALRVALAAEVAGLPPNWVFLSAGTDGRDGPTEAAGAIVDAATPSRIRAAGADPLALLAANDSHRALALSGDLLVSGPTGTNVADVMAFLRT